MGLERDGKVVADAVGTYFIRKRDAAPKKKGAPKAEPEIPSKFLFEEAMTVRDDQTTDYAEASKDHNPVHLDDGVASAAGLKGIIVHGLCTMAFAQAAIINKAAGGDPTRLARLKVRFAKPVYPGETVTTQAWKMDETGDTLTLGFRVINPAGEVVVTNGVAEVNKA